MSATPPTSSDSIPQRLRAIREQLTLLADYVDPNALEARVGELEQEMGEPGFWDSQEKAARTSAEHARASRKLDSYRGLVSDVDDLEPLAEMAQEDAEMAGELAEQIASVQRRLEALEEERLFSGRYDAGDALVTINAGAGGTDAQDWAEMMLRMEMRWAEKRGFDLELLEVSPGRRPASSRRPSSSEARTPTVSTAPRRASTGSCA